MRALLANIIVEINPTPPYLHITFTIVEETAYENFQI